MADTRRRVKLYMLNEDRQWDDRGTGHVSSAYVDRLEGMSLLVRSETDGEIKRTSGFLFYVTSILTADLSCDLYMWHYLSS